MRTVLLRGVVLAGAAAFGAMTAGASAQPGQPSNESVLAALLTEVRGLRAAIEQMAAAGPRVQLALGRLQLQEQRINTMLRRHESVRDTLSSAQRDRSVLEVEIARMEEALKAADTRPDRADFVQAVTFELEEGKRKLAAASAETQRLQTEEAMLQQQIATEQGRWSDINRMLEDLERALGRR